MLLLALLQAPVVTPPIAWVEAEACEMVSAVRKEPGDSIFASGGKFTPHYWAQTAGDRLTWKLSLPKPLHDGWLAVRYAYGRKEFNQYLDAPRTLRVTSAGRDLELAVPDTGTWAHYEIAWVRLPSLPASSNRITVEATQTGTNTDIDCMAVFAEKPAQPAAPFVNTLIAISPDGWFHYRRSAMAQTPPPAKVFGEFKRIYELMDAYGGWKPATPIGINVIEDKQWPNAGWSAFSNNAGCFFKASAMPGDYGNWCHEMTHLMFEGRCPRWLEEPLVHTLTRLVWVTRLYADGNERAVHANAVVATGKDFRENPAKRFDSVEPVLYALANRYGPDVFGRFLKACVAAGKAKELDMTPGRHLTTAEVMKYLSKATGEDVTPMFRRWTGFAAVEFS